MPSRESASSVRATSEAASSKWSTSPVARAHRATASAGASLCDRETDGAMNGIAENWAEAPLAALGFGWLHVVHLPRSQPGLRLRIGAHGERAEAWHLGCGARRAPNATRLFFDCTGDRRRRVSQRRLQPTSDGSRGYKSRPRARDCPATRPTWRERICRLCRTSSRAREARRRDHAPASPRRRPLAGVPSSSVSRRALVRWHPPAPAISDLEL